MKDLRDLPDRVRVQGFRVWGFRVSSFGVSGCHDRGFRVSKRTSLTRSAPPPLGPPEDPRYSPAVGS